MWRDFPKSDMNWERFGDICQYSTTYDNTRQELERYGHIWQGVGSFGNFRKDVGRSGEISQYLPTYSITAAREVTKFRNRRKIRKTGKRYDATWQDSARLGICDKVGRGPHVGEIPQFRSVRIPKFPNPQEIRTDRATSGKTWGDFGRLGNYEEICQEPHFRGIRNFGTAECPGDSERPANVWQEVTRFGMIAGRRGEICQEPHFRWIQKFRGSGISEYRAF